MRNYARVARPKRNLLSLRGGARFKITLRPLARQGFVAPRKHRSTDLTLVAPAPEFQLDPYLDYGRFLTNEGGILIVYKDHDLRWRHTIWRLFAWTSFTGLEAHYLFSLAPLSQWVAIGALLVVAIVNWLIVMKPVELYRRIEIRPDCMIVEGNDVFWTRFIEGGLPSCRPDAEGNQIFCGIYGTRFVEYLTIRRFDENDRMPQVMAGHLQDAMRQLWTVPY